MSIPVLTVLEYVDTLDPLKASTFNVVRAVIDKRANHSVLLTEILQHVLLGIAATLHASGEQNAVEWDMPLTKPVKGFSKSVSRTCCTDGYGIAPAIHHSQ